MHFLFPAISSSVSSVGFSVTSVTMTGQTYDAGGNHAPDGDSDGTTITAQNPATPNGPPTAADVAAASDVDGDAVTAVLDAGPSSASSFVLNADGSFSYTPDAPGDDSFTYHAFDGSLASDVVTVTLAVVSTAGVSVTGVVPGSAQTNSIVVVQITGSGFEPGAGVSFEGGAGPSPQATDVVVVDSGTITATVTVRSGGPPRNRVWDVRVTNADGSFAVLSSGFTVMP